ncbi:MAG: ABC transporter permease [Anaerolineae bacterium]|nr:ABC transporter permease [Anaerolineae bacterium]
MNKMWLIARREYLYNLRRPAFLFAVFGAPLFTFFMWFVIFALISNSESDIESVGKVGYVDQAGLLANPTFPGDGADRFVAFADETAARAELDARTIGAYFVLPPEYLRNGAVPLYSFSGAPEALKDEIETFLLANLSQQLPAGVPLDRIQSPVELTVHANDSGRDLTEANVPALVFIPMIFAFVFLMAAGVTSGYLMNGIVEERTNRIMEILVTSVTPTQILGGKILGLGALGLTQIVIWLAAGALLIRFGQNIPALSGVAFPVDLMIVLLVYFVLAYFLLAAIQAGIGALVGSEEESRQYASILSILFIIPFFFIITFVTEPNGTTAMILTFIPFTSPMTMLLRLGFGAVPAWQIVASMLILLVTTILIAWLSARVFRWALLRYGKRLSLRDVWRGLRSSSRMETVAAHSAQQEG